MTKQDIPRNSSIDRRTVLGLLSGGLAALAGCSGGLSDSSDGGDGSAGPPEEQSDYIEETIIKSVRGGREIVLEVAVTDDTDPTSISIITESGKQYSSEYFDSGETRTSVSLTQGEDTHEPLSRGKHKLHLRGDGVETEVPLELGSSYEVEEVISGSERSGLLESHLGVIIRNIGQRTGAAARVVVNGETEDELLVPIEPGEENLVRFPYLIEDTVVPCKEVDETSERTERLSVEFLWSDPVTFTQTISYENSSGCERGLVGTPEVITDTSTETET